MRITHVTDVFLPRIGGIEVQVAGLAHAQADARRRVTVITATPSATGPAVEEPVPVVRLSGRRGSMFGPPVRSIRAAVARSLPDVLHCHTSLLSPLAVSAVRYGVLAGIPTVVTVHSTWGAPIRAVYGWADGLSRWSGWPVVWTTVSTSCVDAMRPLLPAGELVLVPNAIDVRAWAGAAQGVRPGTGVHVVAVGRLAARKQSMNLLRVLRGARERLPATIGLRATIVGEGSERARMLQYLARYGMSGWVRMTGALSPGGVRDVVCGADVFLAPARLESFGIAALEARTAGVPVLARAGTGIADFVRHGREGLLARSRAEMVEGLVRLAVDPGLRASIALHNQRVVPWRYDWPAVLSALDGCYEQARNLCSRPALSLAPDGAGSTTNPVRPGLRVQSPGHG